MATAPAKVQAPPQTFGPKLTNANATVRRAPAEQVNTGNVKPGETVLKGPFSGYASFLTPKGTPYAFYQGYLATDNQEIIDAARQIPGVARTDETSFPRPPDRMFGRNRNATFSAIPTQVNPAEIMQMAIAGSNTVPQAAESTSVQPN